MKRVVHEMQLTDQDIFNLHIAICKAIGIDPTAFSTTEVLSPICVFLGNILSMLTERQQGVLMEDLVRHIGVVAKELRANPAGQSQAMEMN